MLIWEQVNSIPVRERDGRHCSAHLCAFIVHAADRTEPIGCVTHFGRQPLPTTETKRSKVVEQMNRWLLPAAVATAILAYALGSELLGLAAVGIGLLIYSRNP